MGRFDAVTGTQSTGTGRSPEPNSSSFCLPATDSPNIVTFWENVPLTDVESESASTETPSRAITPTARSSPQGDLAQHSDHCGGVGCRCGAGGDSADRVPVNPGRCARETSAPADGGWWAGRTGAAEGGRRLGSEQGEGPNHRGAARGRPTAPGYRNLDAVRDRLQRGRRC